MGDQATVKHGPRPIALTIAGSDSSGGAGIQADLKTMSVLGVYGASVITALTAQNTRGVSGVLATSADFVTQQLDAVCSDLDVSAVKTGMLGTRETVLAVYEGIMRHRLRHLVVDPVMVATSGDILLDPDAIDAVRHRLIPQAAIITPNLAEAAVLLGTGVATSLGEMGAQARALSAQFGAKAVLLKGGHNSGENAVDVLLIGDDLTQLSRPRVPSLNTHGTGCTLSAAVTAFLARDCELAEAVERAKGYVWEALLAGQAQTIGHGHGPVDHLHGISDPK